MNCPNCGLINPPSALRCDCGFDFVSRSIQASYADQAKIREGQSQSDVDQAKSMMLWHLIIVEILLTIGLIGSLAAPEPKVPAIINIVIAIVVLLLSLATRRRSNAARIALIILTFPFGLMLTRASVREYCGQS